MEREVRYCTSEDGTRIAYCVEGAGPPLLAAPSLFESFSFDHILPQYHQYLLKIAEGRQLIRFDPRGTGLSQRDVSDFSADAQLKDGRAVMVACGLDRYALYASTLTGPFAIRAAIEHQPYVQALVLYGSCASISRAFTEGTLPAFAALAAA